MTKHVTFCSVNNRDFWSKSDTNNLIYEVGCADVAGFWIEKSAAGWQKTPCFDLVLQDPTTAVDSVTEQDIAERVARRRAGRTTLVVSEAPAWHAVADHHRSLADLLDGDVRRAGEGAR